MLFPTYLMLENLSYNVPANVCLISECMCKPFIETLLGVFAQCTDFT